MLRAIKKLYFKWFVEETIGYRLRMLHRHWDAEQEAKRAGREFERVPESLLMQM
jgi:hypothetical protein